MTERVFAIGDIHGCFDALKNLIEEKIKPRRKDKIILLGDYIDRGRQSKEVIDYIMDMQKKGLDLIALKGNHEAMLLNAFENEQNFPMWMMNGGYETIHSFSLNSITELDSSYIFFFQNLQLYYSFDHFLFVHAGFNDKLKDPFSDTREMLWSRNQEYANPLLKDKIIIHGHTPIPLTQCERDVAMRKSCIDIDTGCIYSSRPGLGKLTALEVFSYELHSI